MRKFMSLLALSVAVIALNASLLAKTATVTGKVVDEGCGLPAAGGHSEHGADHKMEAGKDHQMADGHMKAGEDMTECMIMCAKNGEPMALLTADGKVYRIAGGLAANKNAKLIAHIGKNVQITGDVFEKDGKVQIAADSLRAMK